MSDSGSHATPGAQPRPAVAVVMPFAGTPEEAHQALSVLGTLVLDDGDAVVLSDNSGTAPARGIGRVRVVRASGERSPSHARNVGAAATGDTHWLLFLDADVTPAPDLLDAFFADPIAGDVGAVAGAVRADHPAGSLAARYGADRNFLDSDAHLRHPYRARVASANLLVRRAAFDAVGGFAEGIRTAEDTDLSWRLQEAGWTLALRPGAHVTHAYRPTLRRLRAQWRAYAAGRAWLARRYPGYAPQPALLRAVARVHRAHTDPGATPRRATSPQTLHPAAGAAIDVLLGVEELVGLLLPNRPRGGGTRPAAAAVLVAERLTADDHVPAGARVETAVRPSEPTEAWVDAREDDGTLQRLAATLRLALAAPRAVRQDRRAGGPALRELAPAALRLRADGPAVAVTPTPDAQSAALAARLQLLAGRPV